MLLSRYQIQVKDHTLYELPRLNFEYSGGIFKDDTVLVIRNDNANTKPLITLSCTQDYAVLQQLTVEQYTVLTFLPTIESICTYLEYLKE